MLEPRVDALVIQVSAMFFGSEAVGIERDAACVMPRVWRPFRRNPRCCRARAVIGLASTAILAGAQGILVVERQ